MRLLCRAVLGPPRRVQACQTYVWDMQKERRAKNCFEDLTTQLQEEVKLVPWHRIDDSKVSLRVPRGAE